jgi:hypothetical protein
MRSFITILFTNYCIQVSEEGALTRGDTMKICRIMNTIITILMWE